MQGGTNLWMQPTRVSNIFAFSTSAVEQFDLRLPPNGHAAWGWADEYMERHQRLDRAFHDSAQMTPTAKSRQELRLSSSARRLLILATSSLVRCDRIRAKRLLLEARTRIRRFPVAGWLRSRRARSFRPVCPYVLLTLQSEPETALGLNSPHLPTQAELIASVAQALPLTHHLLVKDYPRMAGARPFRVWNSVTSRSPNVSKAPIEANTLGLIRDAALVITPAGTPGLEALMLGVPALVLGACHYQNLYGATVNTNALHLPTQVRDALDTDWDPRRVQAAVRQHIASIK